MLTPTLPRIQPRKSLGQHFLRDENIARKIVAAVNPRPGDVMVEIGPGQGALTRYLAPSVKKLIAIDIDQRIVTQLERFLSGPQVTFLCQDFLRTNLAELAGGEKLRIVGNIPYNITTPILFHILDNRRFVWDGTLMVQREVARRLVAQPNTKDYGILSVFCQLFTDVALLFDVSPHSFVPSPAVFSSVVKLTILPGPRYIVRDEEFFRSMIRSVFGKRRKTLRNSLGYFLKERGCTVPSRFFLQQRPEDLTLAQLVDLSNALYAELSPLPGTSSSVV